MPASASRHARHRERPHSRSPNGPGAVSDRTSSTPLRPAPFRLRAPTVRTDLLFTMTDEHAGHRRHPAAETHETFLSTDEFDPARPSGPPAASDTTPRPEATRWWSQTGSNRRPHACKARALPTELWPRRGHPEGTVVGPERFELSTSRLSSARSNQLSYGPRARSWKLVREERETKTAVSRASSGFAPPPRETRRTTRVPRGSRRSRAPPETAEAIP